jgi:hypothetical protein
MRAQLAERDALWAREEPADQRLGDTVPGAPRLELLAAEDRDAELR